MKKVRKGQKKSFEHRQHFVDFHTERAGSHVNQRDKIELPPIEGSEPTGQQY